MRRLSVVILFAVVFVGCCIAAKRERLTPYLVDKANNSGIGIIVCPGGSYSWLDKTNEGETVAKWLNANGITAFLLKYRVATVAAYVTGFRVLGIGHKYPDMLEDVEDALREVYERADEFGVDRAKIGVMGFSAGGHLAMMSYLYNRTEYKPTFLCCVYPVVTMSRKESHKRSRRGALGVWRQWDKQMRDSLSIEKHVTSDCPPVFIVDCADDKVVNPRNSLMLDSALSANKVKHSYYIYEEGGHGFGVSETKGSVESRQWKGTFIKWLHNILGWI